MIMESCCDLALYTLLGIHDVLTEPKSIVLALAIVSSNRLNGVSYP